MEYTQQELSNPIKGYSYQDKTRQKKKNKTTKVWITEIAPRKSPQAPSGASPRKIIEIPDKRGGVNPIGS